jgi:REP element-mobilizing transposase RayT
MYFITVCVKEKAYLLGKIIGLEAYPNKLGDLVKTCWLEIPDHYPSVTLDAFVVMPNHIHGIIYVGAGSPRPSGSLRPSESAKPPYRPTLGNIMGYFKYQSTQRINELRQTPRTSFWQRNYFEHVIRDDNSLNRIREYIMTNPQRWELDRNNPLARGSDEFDRWLAGIKSRPPVSKNPKIRDR